MDHAAFPRVQTAATRAEVAIICIDGIKLVQVTWFQSIAEFPIVSVGASYLPVPIGGAITALFVIERIWTGRYFPEPHAPDEISTVTTE